MTMSTSATGSPGPDVVNIFFTSSIPLVISLKVTEKFMADRWGEMRAASRRGPL
jgi:hypothetical protein